MIRNTALSLCLVLTTALTASATNLLFQSDSDAATLHEIQTPNIITNNRRSDRDPDRGSDRNRRERFVCMVQPPDSSDRNRPYMCNTSERRVGASCRCSGVVGSGTVDLDYR